MAASVEGVLSRLKIEVRERKGTRLWALCPYHDDHSPSWFIRGSGRHEGQHHCYACKAGGTLVELVEHVLEMKEEEARLWLEEHGPEKPKAGPVPPRVEIVVAEDKVFQKPREVILRPLEDWPGPPRNYLIARGVDPHQVMKWRIGYAVDGRLAGRLVVPILDRSLRWRSYVARSFDGSAKRYLYPSADEGADQRAMFGYAHAHAVPAAVVTEGAFDAMAVERALRCVSDVNVLALGGSMVRPAHVAKISGHRTVVILTDADDAGDRAASELERALARHVPKLVRVRLAKDANDTPVDELRRSLCTALT